MVAPHYYNEFDPHAAAWLRELIRAGHLPAGDVDERDIRNVEADDLRRYVQCHFFAGIGGWPLGLRLAGWPDDRPCWTGSCPCPPFSSAGRKKPCPECNGKSPVPCPRRTGFFICSLCEHAWHADDRHLWPELWRLIRDGRPSVCFGEQVASADGRLWLAGVRGSLEILGYAAGGADLCGPCVGSPDIRQRLWWVADANCTEFRREPPAGQQPEHESNGRIGGMDDALQVGRRARPEEVQAGRNATQRTGRLSRLADSECAERRTDQQHEQLPVERDQATGGLGSGGYSGWLANGLGTGLERHPWHGDDGDQPGRFYSTPAGHVAAGGGVGFWSDFDLIPCRDGKARRIEPGTFPLAHGIPGRVGLLRGYGNAVKPQVVSLFVEAYREVTAGDTLSPNPSDER